MDYVINEYSLSGQFACPEVFFDSIRTYTWPLLQKIEKEQGSVIWKKETLWQQEVCPGIPLGEIRPKRNERNAELTMLKVKLQKLYNTDPYWNEDEMPVLVTRYCFDETRSNHFPMMNCFVKAHQVDGRLVSFEHEAYQSSRLEIWLEKDGKETPRFLDNLYCAEQGDEQEKITKWPRIQNLYRVEVRAREVDRHKPHFHVTYNEYSAVFDIADGSVIEEGSCPMPGSMRQEIDDWYQAHADELRAAWNRLHKTESDSFT